MSNESKVCDCNQGRMPCACKTAEPGTGYTAVDMATAAAQGFRDGAASVVVDLEPDEPADEGAAYLHIDFVKSRIIAAGGSVKDGN